MEQPPGPLPDEIQDLRTAFQHQAGLNQYEKASLEDVVVTAHIGYMRWQRATERRRNGQINNMEYSDIANAAQTEWRGRCQTYLDQSYNPLLREWCRILMERLRDALRLYDIA